MNDCKEGYVYVITAGKIVKIGATRQNPLRDRGRLFAIRNACPDCVPRTKLSLLVTRRVKHPFRVEKHLVERYKPFRVAGREWLTLSNEELARLEDYILSLNEVPDKGRSEPFVRTKHVQNHWTPPASRFGGVYPLMQHYRGGTAGPFDVKTLRLTEIANNLTGIERAVAIFGSAEKLEISHR